MLTRCTYCDHHVHTATLDAKGRCGNCVNDVKRRWDHRKERRETVVDPYEGVRAQRNMLLAATDWTNFAPLSAERKAAWDAYRQALRDITEQPIPVEWPVKPE